MLRAIAILITALLVGACQHTQSSVAGSCKVFERPPYAVRGVTRYDQNVADNFVESGVAGCNWKRPAPRPAELDARPLPKATPIAKRRSLATRIKDRVKAVLPASPAPAPIAAAPPAPAQSASPISPLLPPAPSPIPPRRPIDELLRPSGAGKGPS